MAEIGEGFNVRLNLDELRDFEQFADQFPFAISLAMNWTAKQDAVPAMRAGLYQSKPKGAGLTVRTPYTERGIQFFKSASKRDLTVKVGAVSEYLLAATEGTHDDSRPDGGRPLGAVPIGPTREPKSTKLARRADWPMQLIRRGLAYRPGVDHERKTKQVKVQGRDGKTRNRKVKEGKIEPLRPGQALFGTSKSSTPGQPLWFIEDDRNIEIPPAYPALPLVKESFDSDFSDQLRKAIRRAIRTRRAPR